MSDRIPNFGWNRLKLATLTYEQITQLEEQVLARIALAAMGCEPVAWLAIYHGEVYDEAIGITRSVVEAQADHFGWESALTEIIPLYRHAQPAPVVPDEIRNRLKAEGLAEVLKDARDYAPLTAWQWETLTNNWHQTFVGLSGEDEACRAAMLKGDK